MILYLRKEFAREWKDKDPFKEADKLEGKVYRQVKRRRTLQFEFNGRSYFIKIHHGVGWREIFKNLFQFKTTILGASNEFYAIRKLERLNVQTMRVAGFARKGWNPASQDSFIITDDIQNCISLEDYCRPWKETAPDFTLKNALLRKVAWTSRQLHTNGINHRDYYICHFLLDPASFKDNEKLNKEAGELTPEPRTTNPEPLLYLIDLHRAQIRNKTPKRWIIKDVSGIWFSSMDIGLTKRDLLRFIRIYSGKGLREELKKNVKFWTEAHHKAVQLYKKDFGREPSLPFEI